MDFLLPHWLLMHSERICHILVIGRIRSLCWLCKPWNAVFIEDRSSEAGFADFLRIHGIYETWSKALRCNKQNQGNVESRHADISAICQWHVSFHTNYACRLQAEGIEDKIFPDQWVQSLGKVTLIRCSCNINSTMTGSSHLAISEAVGSKLTFVLNVLSPL